jgi:hypothetical protein
VYRSEYALLQEAIDELPVPNSEPKPRFSAVNSAKPQAFADFHCRGLANRVVLAWFGPRATTFARVVFGEGPWIPVIT